MQCEVLLSKICKLANYFMEKANIIAFNEGKTFKPNEILFTQHINKPKEFANMYHLASILIQYTSNLIKII